MNQDFTKKSRRKGKQRKVEGREIAEMLGFSNIFQAARET